MPIRRRSRKQAVQEATTCPLVLRLVLRLIVPLGGASKLVGSGGYSADVVFGALGMEFDPEGNRKEVLAILRSRFEEAESAGQLPDVPAELARNIVRLQRLLQLSESDCRILEFAILVHSERALDETGDLLGELSILRLVRVLSDCLDLPEHEVRTAIRSDGLLSKSGLLSVSKAGLSTLRTKLQLLSDGFVDQMLSEVDDPLDLLRGSVIPAAPPHLSLDDFPHVDSSLKIVQPFLRCALDERRRGVNVLVYGDPGTGKTQLARLLALQAGADLFEVSSCDGDGDPVSGEQRLCSYRAAQCFFDQRRAMVVFDEIEDVFNDGGQIFGRRSTAQVRKAWVNRILEDNAVPTVWLSNEVGGMDPAFIRRFDIVIQLNIPPLRQRQKITADVCHDLLGTEGLARISQAQKLAPAVIARAANVVRTIRHDIGADQTSNAVEQLINATLTAQHGRGLAQLDLFAQPENYDLGFVHADADLDAIAAGILEAPSARLCLYGPPGTGKTAFGGWLAHRMERPLHVRRASDILGPYVGMTEQNIAAAFREASEDRAILLFDEVDSFLRDRRGADRSWEVSQVNEMLTQMETFQGVFIASTNLMDNIDQAALRRFDVKVRFDYIRDEQAWALMLRHCEQMGLQPPEGATRAQLAQLKVLTPGDFAAVARAHRFRPLRDAAQMLDALRAECGLKQDGRAARIGFV